MIKHTPQYMIFMEIIDVIFQKYCTGSRLPHHYMQLLLKWQAKKQEIRTGRMHYAVHISSLPKCYVVSSPWLKCCINYKQWSMPFIQEPRGHLSARHDHVFFIDGCLTWGHVLQIQQVFFLSQALINQLINQLISVTSTRNNSAQEQLQKLLDHLKRNAFIPRNIFIQSNLP